MRLIQKEVNHSLSKKSYDKEAKMDPTYFLLLIFVPVPVMLLYAIIVDIYDRKKQSKENQKIGQSSAS
jgi:hypothetical protein